MSPRELELAWIGEDNHRQLDGNAVMVGGTQRIYGVSMLGTKERRSCSEALPGAIALPR